MNDTSPTLWRRFVAGPTKRTRYRDWLFGLSAIAYGAFTVVSFAVWMAVAGALLGIPLDTDWAVMTAGAIAGYTPYGFVLRRRYRRQHGMDAA
jgi:hypothetical protein